MPPSQSPAPLQEPIAIVGMSCRLPGARNHEELWHNLRNGICSVRQIPPERWDPEAFYAADPSAEGKTVSKWAGLIDDVDKFDASFFRISPREAALMDPQQRLLLELTWGCFENAGYDPHALRGASIGVFIGACNFDYKELLERERRSDAHLGTGTYVSLIANRISHEYDLRGPSMPIDTACSSALVALHQAVQAIARGDCSSALVGGVSILCSPTYFISFAKAGMLSPVGRCSTFDAAADGYVRGEGAGLLFLKPLAVAEQDGDRIWGVIRGSAVNHGGHAPSVTSPGAFAQARVIAEALRRANVAPNTISYVEAHGTGTPKGDPIEVHGLQRGFASAANHFGVELLPGSCALGSVKPNLGHLEAAAGVAGLIRTLVSMKHAELAPLLHFQRMNPRIRLEGSPFFIAQERREWCPPSGVPRRAGVSSFGFGGVNAHVVLEEYPVRAAAVRAPAGEQVFPLSARNGGRLRAYAVLLAEALPESGERAVASTLQKRSALEERVAFVASSLAELKGQLLGFASGRDAGGWHVGNAEGKSQLEPKLKASQCTPSELARAWAHHAPVDWQEPIAPPSEPPQLIELPGYPFELQRHWLPQAPSAATVAAPHAAAAPELLLLQPRWAPHALLEASPARRPLYITLLDSSAAQAFRDLRLGTQHVALLAPDPQAAPPAWTTALWQALAQIRDGIEADPPDSFCLLSSQHADFATMIFAALQALERELELPLDWYEWPSSLDPAAAVACAAADSRRAKPQSGCFRLRANGEDLYCEARSWALEPWRDSDAPSPDLRGRVYWITGGNGGIARTIADWLSGELGATVISSGRAPGSSAEGRSPLAAGSQHYYSADCTKPAELRAVLSQIHERHGRLSGVIHCAGALRDRSIFSKTSEDVQCVAGPKIEGALWLDELTRELPLDLFLVFSSVSALLGNAGQTDYAAANSFLAQFVERRRELVVAGKRAGASCVIDWPYWQSGGMKLDPALESRLERTLGLVPLPNASALRVLKQVFQSHPARCSIVYGERSALTRALNPGASAGRLPGAVAPSVRAPEAEADAARSTLVASELSEASVALVIAELTGTRAEELSRTSHFSEYGLDSLSMQALLRRIDKDLGLRLSVSDLQRNASIVELTRLLKGRASNAATSPAPQRPAAVQASGAHATDVAIIGLNIELDGASSADELWSLLERGLRLARPFPESRWRRLPAALRARCPVDSCRGFFLDDALSFDHRAFAISPREAMLMDPQQRLLLQSVWLAIENAGYSKAQFAERPCSLFLAIDAVDYEHLVPFDRKLDQYSVSGTSRYIAANRLSYVFNLRGESEPVATACSSFFVGLGRAVDAISAGSTEQAIVAAAQLNLLPERFAQLRERGLLSAGGHTLSFAEQADGFVRGEAVGSVVLKALGSAQRDGDPIHAVIKGVGAWHAGSSFGLATPNATAHEQAIRIAMRRAGCDASRLDYVEGHGTGMPLGDGSEIEAIASVLDEQRSPEQPACVFGAAKPTLGHLEAASGVGALAKAILSLSRGQVPGLAYLSRPPAALVNSRLCVSDRQQALGLRADGLPLCAGLLSYGLGGVSSFVLIEQARERSVRRANVATSFDRSRQFWIDSDG